MHEPHSPLLRLAKRDGMPRGQVWAIRLGSFAAALLISALIFLIMGHNPLGAFGTMVTGSLGKKTAIRQTVRIAIPLLGTALAIAPCFKMRFWNIGAEGQITAGAVGASYFALFWADTLPAPVLLVVPTRRLMGLYHPEEAQALNEHNGTGMPHSPAGDLTRRFMALAEVLHERQIDFDVAEEWMVEQYAAPASNGIRLGRAIYSTVIASQDCLWQNSRPPVPDLVLLPANALHWRLTGAGLNQLLLDKPESRVPVPDVPLEGVFVVSLDPLAKLCVMG